MDERDRWRLAQPESVLLGQLALPSSKSNKGASKRGHSGTTMCPSAGVGQRMQNCCSNPALAGGNSIARLLIGGCLNKRQGRVVEVARGVVPTRRGIEEHARLKDAGLYLRLPHEFGIAAGIQLLLL